MKVLGITAEYNPFHNGHKYHIEKSREMTGADCVVAVMSGNFTQRGEAAILDKWERSRLAVENGVDLVVELPFIYACSKAQSFAEGAVDILKGLGVHMISFGSESGEIS
ncbi:MAG: nucleotidyltransferase family protein, partial [Firmicutes bacterium]|nr:nucleotidyltransferase family protein [Bacillota bacterium]